MSVKRSVSISLLSQAFFVATRLVVVPIYLHLMGIEAYGLIGLFMLFTALIQLFNFGISSTVSREISRMQGGAVSSATVRYHLRRSATIMGVVSLGFVVVVTFLAPLIATRWLHVHGFVPEDVTLSLRLFAPAAALTFLASLFRGGLLGLERQVTLNLLGILFTALRSLGVILVLLWISPTPVTYAMYQLIVSVLELAVFRTALGRALPPASGKPDIERGKNRNFRRFAGGIAFTDIVWAGVTQLDRFVLSTALTMGSYGAFIVLNTAAYSIPLLFAPIFQALQPRFTVMVAEDRLEEIRDLYFRTSYGVSATCFSMAGIFAAFPVQIIFLWTGNHAIAAAAAGVLPLYALGNAISCVLSLPFLLQFATGNIRIHVIGHLATAILYVPSAVWLGLHYGAFGTAAAWLGMNSAYMVLVVPFIHARVLPHRHVDWLVQAIGPSAAIALTIAFGATWLPISANRIAAIAELCGIGACCLALTLVSSAYYRNMMASYVSATSRRVLGGRFATRRGHL